MTNGRIDAARIDAILSGGDREIMRYLVTQAMTTEDILDDLPETIAEAVAEATGNCRASMATQREQLSILWREHEQRQGVRGAIGTTSRVVAWTIGILGTLVGILSAALAFLS